MVELDADIGRKVEPEVWVHVLVGMMLGVALTEKKIIATLEWRLAGKSRRNPECKE